MLYQPLKKDRANRIEQTVAIYMLRCLSPLAVYGRLFIILIFDPTSIHNVTQRGSNLVVRLQIQAWSERYTHLSRNIERDLD